MSADPLDGKRLNTLDVTLFGTPLRVIGEPTLIATDAPRPQVKHYTTVEQVEADFGMHNELYLIACEAFDRAAAHGTRGEATGRAGTVNVRLVHGRDPGPWRGTRALANLRACERWRDMTPEQRENHRAMCGRLLLRYVQVYVDAITRPVRVEEWHLKTLTGVEPVRTEEEP